MSRSTASGRTKPYVFQTRCAKDGCTITESNAWEALRWEWDKEEERNVLKRVLLCDNHGRRAKAYYESRRGS